MLDEGGIAGDNEWPGLPAELAIAAATSVQQRAAIDFAREIGREGVGQRDVFGRLSRP